MRTLTDRYQWMVAMLMAGTAMHVDAAIEMPFTRVFSGSPPQNSTTPWLTAAFAEGTGGTVLFTLNTLHLTNPENVSSLYLNFNDNLNVQNLVFQFVSGGGFTIPTINLNQDGFKADGDGKYDIRLDFATGGNANQTFNQGDSLTYQVSYSGGISPADFLFLSKDAGGSGPFLAAAHVQNTPGGGGWIAAPLSFVPVPEASGAIAAGTVAAFWLLGFVRGRRFGWAASH